MKKLSVFFASLILIATVLTSANSFAQEKVIIDQVIAVVGTNAILESEVINQQRQMQAQMENMGPDGFCMLFDEMLYQKLLYHQAMIDSVEVGADQVETVLDRRLRYFIQQIGSREKLEAYYGKSLEELKEEFRDIVYEQELSRAMEGNITKNVNVTPAEVRLFFRNIPQDSIPMVESELMLAHIVMEPPIRQEEIALVKERLEEFRQRVLQGESFNTLAILYSEDPGSARRGGELGFYSRGDLFPQFEAVAYGLRPGEVSEIVETQAGYHIIQMIERRGEQINVRHILLQPKVTPQDLVEARNKLDSVKVLIDSGEMTFEEAAIKFSNDPGKMNQGLIINPYSGTSKFRAEELDSELFFVIDQLEEGELSNPVSMVTEEGKQAFRLVKVVSRTDPHPANLTQDYDFIQQLALQKKERKAIQNWINSKLSSTFVFIHDKYNSCNFEFDWIKESQAEKN